jgi:23S rRNA pseudouridine1911/1915/1917 synthase
MNQNRTPEKKTLEVEADGVRLDKYLAASPLGLTRSYLQKLIEEGGVRVNGQAARPAAKLRYGDRIDIVIPATGPVQLAAEDIPLEVVYEDIDLAVINKPAGLTVYPAPGHPSHTLVNAMLKRFPDLSAFGNSPRPGIVHRLDKDTSGLMVIARNEKARLNLAEQFKSRSVVKRYLVLVKGKIVPERGAIDAPIGRDPADRKRMAIVSKGRQARTDYRVQQYMDGYSLLEVRIQTGRSHQIRVHFSAIGYPVVGDKVYGVKSKLLSRQFLHAHFLEIVLPGSGQIRSFTCVLPADLSDMLTSIQKG